MFRTTLYLALIAVFILITLGYTQDSIAPNTQPQAQMGERCEEILARHHQLKSQMAAMDKKLGVLVKEMNQARGSGKIDAMAAVINEMVKQRKAAHERTMSMQRSALSHAAEHMQSGSPMCQIR